MFDCCSTTPVVVDPARTWQYHGTNIVDVVKSGVYYKSGGDGGSRRGGGSKTGLLIDC